MRLVALSVISSIVLSAMLVSCGRDSASQGKVSVKPRASAQSSGVSEVLAAGMAESDKQPAADIAESDKQPASEKQEKKPVPEPVPVPPVEQKPLHIESKADGIDVDLTALSSTMVYSEVFNMMVSPEKYIGKTIRMAGQFYSSYDEIRDKRYYACLIMDATACCAQGMEFELEGECRYPEDFPEEGGMMCVVGVFDSYEEDGCAYATLRNARMISG
ncbi:MAG: hypothetical protein IJU95_04495 [Treponema sp.]|nr:hypothetical protein [Treponema sp.]